MAETMRPQSPEQMAEAVTWAVAREMPIEVHGERTKAGLGGPRAGDLGLDTRGLYGITLYEPEELVLTARAGTSMAEIRRELDQARQYLAFEPVDLGPLYGVRSGGGTVGGLVACNLSGPRRGTAGSVRDHVLGLEAVSGRGEAFVCGGRVVKNVTGFDLPRLLAGSFGTLAVVTSVTLKVLPRPEAAATLVLIGLDPEAARRTMGQALASPHGVSGAAHLPPDLAAGSASLDGVAQGAAATALRLEGTAASVDGRLVDLENRLGASAPTARLGRNRTRALWREVRDAAYFAETDDQVWRLSLPPTAAPGVAQAILEKTGGSAYFDWGGGLVWLALPPRPDGSHGVVRGALAASGGHATLIRAAPEVRASVPVFQPAPPALAALNDRVRAQFDPRGLLNPGRME